jgi:hypothetical protein
VFNTHPRVRRTALVGVGERGHQVPVLCVELEKDVKKEQVGKILFELEHIGQGYAHTGRITHFFVHPRFPVDIRHNAKIGREQLAVWAARELARQQRAKAKRKPDLENDPE